MNKILLHIDAEMQDAIKDALNGSIDYVKWYIDLAKSKMILTSPLNKKAGGKKTEIKLDVNKYIKTQLENTDIKCALVRLIYPKDLLQTVLDGSLITFNISNQTEEGEDNVYLVENLEVAISKTNFKFQSIKKNVATIWGELTNASMNFKYEYSFKTDDEFLRNLDVLNKLKRNIEIYVVLVSPNHPTTIKAYTDLTDDVKDGMTTANNNNDVDYFNNIDALSSIEIDGEYGKENKVVLISQESLNCIPVTTNYYIRLGQVVYFDNEDGNVRYVIPTKSCI